MSHKPNQGGFMALTCLTLALASACGGGGSAVAADAVQEAPASPTSADVTGRDTFPSNFVVIAHQGASGEMPQHTLEGYEVAIQEGADFVEPDLAMTSDSVLIALHGLLLDRYTDVAQHPEFASRRHTRRLGNNDITGFFAVDFTLAEIKQLRVLQYYPQRSAANNGRFQVPTLHEIIDLVKRHRTAGNLHIGIIPELIAPAWYAAQGMNMEAAFLREMVTAGWTTRNDPVIVQSFDDRSLKVIRNASDLRLMYLIGPATSDPTALPDALQPGKIAAVAKYVDALGIWKGDLITRGTNGRPDSERPEVVLNAEANHLSVYVWTLCRESWCRLERPAWSTAQELAALKRLRVRGAFGDYPADLAAFRDTHP